MTELLQEYVDSGGQTLRVDRETGVLRGVKLIGLQSQNGRRYRDGALGGAVGLYESAKVNVNHAKDGPTAPRDYQDRLGVIRNVEHREGEGLFGELHFNPKHALAEQLVWDAQHNPSNVGFSHNVLARTSRDDGRVVVEEITQVQSVDLVADPASTRGLFEHSGGARNETGTISWSDLTAESLREHRADLWEALCATAEEVVQQELSELREQQRRRSREDQIAQLAVELSPTGGQREGELRGGLGEEFVEMLLAVDDDVRLRRLIQERVDAVNHNHLDSQPRSVEQNISLAPEDALAAGQEFARAICAASC